MQDAVPNPAANQRLGRAPPGLSRSAVNNRGEDPEIGGHLDDADDSRRLVARSEEKSARSACTGLSSGVAS